MLTGLVLSAKIRLKKIPGSYLSVETTPFSSVKEFIRLSCDSENQFEYTVAWLDTSALKKKKCRGLFMRANWCSNKTISPKAIKSKKAIAIPCFFPSFVLNKYSIKVFNYAYYLKGIRNRRSVQHYSTFFFPLDNILHWNKIYGKRGFLQFQCVILTESFEIFFEKVLYIVNKMKQQPFLSVLKIFGSIQSPGLLSFPKPGVTLALDFPNKGNRTLALFRSLYDLVTQYSGRIYPAKDACMLKTEFEQYYPGLRNFLAFKDPNFSSSLWRRVR